MGALGTVITAIVTPFTEDGAVDEDTFVSLLHYLAEHGSDGFVVCGTTGEAATLADDEHLRVIELAVQERPKGVTIIAGTGSNDTAHAVHMTERATDIGVDATLSVTPYYNQPNRRGIKAHYEAIAKATDKPIVLYNIPSRTGARTCRPTCSPSWRRSTTSTGVKQANGDELAPIDGLEIYAGDDANFARDARLRRRRRHPGRQPLRRRRDAPDGRRARPARRDRRLAAGCLRDALHDLQPDVHEGRADDAGPHPRRVPASADGAGRRRRARRRALDARAPRPPGDRRPLSSSLRVLPLGGLGEIGKNMTVVEYDGRIVVVDVGLRFPTAEMVGIDLVLPDFTLPARARGRHRGHRRHARPRGPSRGAAVRRPRSSASRTRRRSTAAS